MNQFMQFYTGDWEWLLILIAGRYYGAMFITPMFNDKWLSKILKILLALIMALTIFPYLSASIVIHGSFFWKITLLIKEIFFGVMLGYLFSLPLWLIQNVGNIIDMQRGEQFGAIINQSTNNPSSSIGNLLLQGYTSYLVVINGLLFFFQLLLHSFKLMPVNALVPNNFLANPDLYIKFFSDYFYWVVVLALPIIVCMFLLDLVLGVIGSFIPSLNITVISMPIKSIMALFLMTFYIGTLYHVATIKFYEHLKTSIINQ